MTWAQCIVELLKTYQVRFLSYVPDGIRGTDFTGGTSRRVF